MKSASDAILRPDQGSYLDALNATGLHALATLGGSAAVNGRDALLTKMESRATEKGYPISDPEVASLLSILARVAQPAFVVELGTNIGYGAIVLARASGPRSRIVTIEQSSDLCDEARAYIAEAGLTERIDVRMGTAIGELEKLETPIDFLYVDCVKEEYPRYLEIALPKLSPRGVVVADNVLWRGQVARLASAGGGDAKVVALAAFNRALVSRPDLCGVVLPIGDGVGLATRIA